MRDSKRLVVTGQLTALQPITVGCGEYEGNLKNRALVAVNHSGTPVIPGTSLAGVMRSRLVQLVGAEAAAVLFGPDVDASELRASPLVVDEAVASELGDVEATNLPLVARTAIDRDRGSAAAGLLFETEYVPVDARFTMRMHLIDPTGRLDGDFDPPAVGIEPGGTSLVRLKMHATRRQWERRSRSIPFRVEADQQGAPAAEVTAAFVQAPVVPERLGARLLALVAVAGLGAAGWVWLLRPAIDSAAEDAVAERPPVQVTITTEPGVTTPTTVVTSVAPADDGFEGGDPQSILLPGSASESDSSSQPWTVPDGKALLVTDYLVQNPAGDSGTASLTFGDPTNTLEWDLAVHLDGIDVTNRFTTPIRLTAGQQVVFDVTCVSPGRPGSSACSARAFINGRLVDA